MEGKIDVHHHYLPAEIVAQLARSLIGQRKGPPVPRWSPEVSSEYMGKVGAGTAMLSFPITFAFEGKEGCEIARQVNEYAAKVRDQDPKRFGFFAAIPSLLEPENALLEIRHAFDNLQADGVMLLARYGDAYLGHPSFTPIWEELNQRSAVVLVHPGSSFLGGARFNQYVDPTIAEFPQETTNTALDMIMNNTLRSFPNCKVILSHAGGTLPYLIRRASALIPMFAAHIDPPPKPAHEILEDFKTFYFDLALSSSAYTLDLLLQHVPHDHILYGSDFPFAPTPATIAFAKELDEYPMSEETRQMINWKNAQALFPRLVKQ
ncbi:Amidohydrolase 2 [Penicillium cf. griseofulvum]|uniref:6-methylsalicylate decarboxylase n=1 Tax=Penicillium cf. griseofulvum TaxID=2972120 RepID=A0A9W9JC61_9EURO|nr:Amidohydrolase 2 [Penicillium cf. griseofulvum]KAJ5445608.1 Amidohydrolase 2 [Penicillium cf. griseofulvum]KAJ5447329.1 Amidohydrolase 2 [Penicillium cf. griseofulvum]